MRLVVKQNNRTVNEFQFTQGPIYIGRRSSNQVCLRDELVSKQHAVIMNVEDGKWMVEDLDSANKTYLNDRAIHKAKIKTGDCLHISSFTIEIDLEDTIAAKPAVDKAVGSKEGADKPAADKPAAGKTAAGKTAADKTAAGKTAADKTAAGKTAAGKTGIPTAVVGKPTTTKSVLLAADMQIIARQPGAEKPSPIRFQGERAVDFLQGTEAISNAGGIDDILRVLLDVLTKQFGAYQTWCALRNQTAGPMTSHTGKQRDGKVIQMNDLKLNEKITEAIEVGEFLLFVFSREPNQEDRTQVRSVLIAPIVSPQGCYGALYVNNTFLDDHYNLGDLDYLMLLAIHTATILEKL